VTSTPLWFSFITPYVLDPYYQVVLGDASSRLQDKTFLFGSLACSGVAGFVLGFRRFRTGVAVLTLTTAVTAYGLIVPTIMQSLREPIALVAQFIRDQTDNQKLGQTAGQATAKPNRIITWRLTAPSLSFAAQRVIPAGSPLLGDWVALPTHLIAELPSQDTTAAQVLFEQTGISLIEIRAKP
jgi:hypothetical protein